MNSASVAFLASVICGATAFLGFIPAVSAQDAASTRSVLGTQQAAGSQVTINQIDTSAFPKVTIFATVTKDGVPLKGLTASSFRVREDEVDQEPLTVAPKLTPLNVVLALDTSGSMKKRLPDAKAAARSFIDMLNKDDQAKVISFAGNVRVLCAEGDREGAKLAIQSTVARGNTALYDALYMAVGMLKPVAGRKAIALLSDGADDDGTSHQLSSHSVKDVLTLAREVNVPIYAIGVGTEIDEPLLKKVGSETGGKCLIAPQPSQLKEMYDKIGEELSGQYTIFYTSNLPGDGSDHRVQLRYAGLTGIKDYKSPELVQATPKPTPTPRATPTPTPWGTPGPASRPINLVAKGKGGGLIACPHPGWALTVDGDETRYSLEIPPGTEAIYGFKDGQSATFGKFGVLIPDAHDCNPKEIELSTADSLDAVFQPLKVVTFVNARFNKTDGWQDYPVGPVTAKYLKVKLASLQKGAKGDVRLFEIRVVGQLAGGANPAPHRNGINLLAAPNGGSLVVSPNDAWNWTIDGELNRFSWYELNSEGVYAFKNEGSAKFDTFGVMIERTKPGNLKEFELFVANDSPGGPFTSIGKFATRNIRMHKDDGWQYFQFPEVTAKYLKVKVISTHDPKIDKAEIHEFEVLGQLQK